MSRQSTLLYVIFISLMFSVGPVSAQSASDFTYQCQADGIAFYYQGESVIWTSRVQAARALELAAQTQSSQLIVGTNQFMLLAPASNNFQIYQVENPDQTRLTLSATICGSLQIAQVATPTSTQPPLAITPSATTSAVTLTPEATAALGEGTEDAVETTLTATLPDTSEATAEVTETLSDTSEATAEVTETLSDTSEATAEVTETLIPPTQTPTPTPAPATNTGGFGWAIARLTGPGTALAIVRITADGRVFALAMTTGPGSSAAYGQSGTPPTPRPPSTNPNPPTGSHVYIVQPGDNLFHIALRNNTSISVLVALNGIRNPSLIYPGQRLLLP